jgi:hypothetical protein
LTSGDSGGALSAGGFVTDARGGTANGSGGRNWACAEANNEVPVGKYDPGEVYLWGTLSEGAGYRDALAPVLAPNNAATGFAANSSGRGSALTLVRAYIDPGRRRFVFGYSNPVESAGDQVLAFHPDGNGCDAYPSAPHSNDEVVAACADGNDRLTGFFIAPDTGDIVVRCGVCPSEKCDLHSTSNAAGSDSGIDREVTLPADHSLFYLGYRGSALLVHGSKLVLKTPMEDLIPLEIDTETALALRAHPNGFWTLRSAKSGTSPERLSIALDGNVTSDGQFPEPPVSTIYRWPETEGDWHRCVFDAKGRVFCFAQSKLDDLTDQVIRAELGADRAEVVYAENASPLVKVHISYLVTGP